MQFRKKPVVIEAIQWDGTKQTWDKIKDMGCKTKPGEMGSNSFFITTLEGDMHCKLGDWVIKGIKGEFYPCKPDIFEATYELNEVEEILVAANKVFKIEYGETYWVSAPTEKEAIAEVEKLFDDKIQPESIYEIVPEEWSDTSFENPDGADGLSEQFTIAEWMEKVNTLRVIASTDF